MNRLRSAMNQTTERVTLELLCQPLNVELTVEERALEHSELLTQLETLKEEKEGLEGEKKELETELTELKQRLDDYIEWAEGLSSIRPGKFSSILDDMSASDIYNELMTEIRKAIRG